MSDTTIWEDQAARKEASKEKRAKNRQESAEYLSLRGIEFYSNNAGVHLIVNGEEAGTIDFWPGTGKWKTKNGKQGGGVKNLVRFIKEANWKSKKHAEACTVSEDVTEELNKLSREG